MKSLVRWQIVSFISRSIAMLLGIVQSIFVVRILSISEYGVIGIVSAIGSIFGVTQHLGLASGSTREISAAKDNSEIFKIFFTSVLIRYFITLPLFFGLLLLSEYLAISKYSNPALILPLKLYAFVLLIQGVQSMFNSVISGTKRFKTLFIYQAVIAVVSLFIYIPLIYFFRVNGYFLALIIFNLIGSLSLGYIALSPLKGSIAFPGRHDIARLLKDILSISLAIYAVKVIYTMWQKSGPILLGVSVTPELVGFFSFALFYGAKLMHISDSVTDVNLPVLSSEYAEDIQRFKTLFGDNFNKVFAFTILSATSAVFWAREIFHLAIGSQKYDQSLPLVFPMVFAFIFYSLVDIIKSSILIPSKLVKEMLVGFIVLLVSTAGFYFVLVPALDNLMAMAFGMAAGASLTFLILTLFAQVKLHFTFFSIKHFLLLMLGGTFSFYNVNGSLLYKVSAFSIFLLVFLLLVVKASFVTKDELLGLKNKLRRPRG